MIYNPEKHRRRSVRLQGHDYSQGAYFVTICTYNRECVLGEIVNGKVELYPVGKAIQEEWHNILNHFTIVQLDTFVVMPNHIHGIIIINNICRGLINQTPTLNNDKTRILMKNPTQTLGKIIRFYKARASKIIRDSGNLMFQWQRNYYEHIIRNVQELNRIREYIMNNPLQWELDNENPKNTW